MKSGKFNFEKYGTFEATIGLAFLGEIEFVVVLQVCDSSGGLAANAEYGAESGKSVGVGGVVESHGRDNSNGLI